MKIASVKDTLTVEGKAAVYTLRVPTKRDKVAHHRRLVATGGRIHGPDAFIARTRRVLALAFESDPAERDRLTGMVDFYAAERRRLAPIVGAGWAAFSAWVRRRVELGEEAAGPPPESVGPMVEAAAAFVPVEEDYARIQSLCARIDDQLAEMLADNEAYGGFYNLAAVHAFVVAAEPRDGAAGAALPPFARIKDEVAAAFVNAMPDGDIAAIGNRIFEAFAPTADEAKNSASPPGGPSPDGANSKASNTGPATSPPRSTPPETRPTAG